MTELRNSTEQFHGQTLDGAEGMECGSLDRFQNSEGQMDVFLVQAVVSDWRVAHRFWASFQLFDPGGVFDIAYQTEISGARFQHDIQALQRAAAKNASQIQEKRKAAACLVLVRFILADQGRNETQLGELRACLADMILTPRAMFDVRPAEAKPRAALINELLSMTTAAWTESLARDLAGIRPDTSKAHSEWPN